MNTETARTLPIDAHLIARDETEYWMLDPAMMRVIESIQTVYIYDENEHTYLCEMQPSYYLFLLTHLQSMSTT